LENPNSFRRADQIGSIKEIKYRNPINQLTDSGNLKCPLCADVYLETFGFCVNALYDALASGKLTAAAIDVYEVEPVSADNPLFKLPNIVTTPHTAAETYETYRAVGLHTAQSILDEFEGTNPPKGL
jgi:D-isomer specific 2-hydroxyacid dehydrogenase, NAD binding domain